MSFDFGFKISPSSHVLMDSVDNQRFKTLRAIEPSITTCIGCGSCTATCTAGQFSEMSLRQIILKMQRGKDDEAIALARHCMLCGKCSMVCPRGINTRNILRSISTISL